MIVGVGIDVVDVGRFMAKLDATPALRDRLFAAEERTLPPNSLAGRFAAKEALAKALGAPGGLHWVDAVVAKNDDGRPYWQLSGTVNARAADLGVQSLHLSISHDAGIASAIVIAED
ncbi:holo-ACP synthase [Leekyejoonella antrihumi]|uniref:Holo-[acyl-carrier-protein] synthase n=1 Tax=Leekyejoonella antrihumi TaxID=1660198 RepID=A0A563E0W5_9MICO|nr:holo-ACP synthase [Leekyejoonella antrihumi]TWP36180.1 holo-ACP synthase [Leekyejoonella antrihumi]